MRSLTIKFSALVVTLLLVTCVTLALIATTHERSSLVAEVQKLGLAFAMNLAANAKEPLLANDDLSLESLVKKVSDENGVVIVRILDRNREVAALSSQVSPSESGLEGNALSEGEKLLITTAPILFSDVLVGEAQVGLDLGILVDPIVHESRRQLATVAFAVILFGVLAGVGFVRLLVGPLRRLRSGVVVSCGSTDRWSTRPRRPHGSHQGLARCLPRLRAHAAISALVPTTDGLRQRQASRGRATMQDPPPGRLTWGFFVLPSGSGGRI